MGHGGNAAGNVNAYDGLLPSACLLTQVVSATQLPTIAAQAVDGIVNFGRPEGLRFEGKRKSGGCCSFATHIR